MSVLFRAVKEEDWNFILKLRNDFFHFFYQQTNPLEIDEHYEYMRKQSTNLNFHHWIIQFEKKDVGYARILNNDVGIMVEKQFQNKGIASEALKLIETEAISLGLKKLVSIIAKDNVSSMKIFEKNKYSLKQYWLEKDIG
jgi:RimJ/RimL family protein N-acetyltransferase